MVKNIFPRIMLLLGVTLYPILKERVKFSIPRSLRWPKIHGKQLIILCLRNNKTNNFSNVTGNVYFNRKCSQTSHHKKLTLGAGGCKCANSLKEMITTSSAAPNKILKNYFIQLGKCMRCSM